MARSSVQRSSDTAYAWEQQAGIVTLALPAPFAQLSWHRAVSLLKTVLAVVVGFIVAYFVLTLVGRGSSVTSPSDAFPVPRFRLFFSTG